MPKCHQQSQKTALSTVINFQKKVKNKSNNLKNIHGMDVVAHAIHNTSLKLAIWNDCLQNDNKSDTILQNVSGYQLPSPKNLDKDRGEDTDISKERGMCERKYVSK